VREAQGRSSVGPQLDLVGRIQLRERERSVRSAGRQLHPGPLDGVQPDEEALARLEVRQTSSDHAAPRELDAEVLVGCVDADLERAFDEPTRLDAHRREPQQELAELEGPVRARRLEEPLAGEGPMLESDRVAQHTEHSRLGDRAAGAIDDGAPETRPAPESDVPQVEDVLAPDATDLPVLVDESRGAHGQEDPLVPTERELEGPFVVTDGTLEVQRGEVLLHPGRVQRDGDGVVAAGVDDGTRGEEARARDRRASFVRQAPSQREGRRCVGGRAATRWLPLGSPVDGLESERDRSHGEPRDGGSWRRVEHPGRGLQVRRESTVAGQGEDQGQSDHGGNGEGLRHDEGS